VEHVWPAAELFWGPIFNLTRQMLYMGVNRSATARDDVMTLHYQPELTPALQEFDIQLIAILDLEDPEDQELWSRYQDATRPDVQVEIEGAHYSVVYAAQPGGFAAALCGLRPC
jgi:hypothetical protein